MSRSDVAVVVIGRDEGARLDRCLAALDGLRVVYVDSGSTDGSPGRARVAGAEVVELDRAGGFTAARARNAGLARLIDDPSVAHVQMLDGDSILSAGWIAAGAAALDADPRLGAVFGGLREDRPDESLYAWLSDIEWTVPPGETPLFSGNVLLRAAAVRGSGGYRAELIAGEDPEFAIRLRAAGWQICCLDEPMAVHQGTIARFGQWWRRTVRGGRGFAALNALHPRSPLHDFARNRRRILFWAGAVPGAALIGMVLAAIVDVRWLVLSAAALLLVGAQLVRVTVRERARHGTVRAFALALFLAIGKYAEMAGLLRYRLSGRRYDQIGPIEGPTP